MSFMGRWFTPSKSDGSGMVPEQPSAPAVATASAEPAKTPAEITAAAEASADEEAKKSLAKRKKIRALSGGKTLLSDTQQTLGGSSLLGA